MSVPFEYQGFDILSQWDGALTSANALAAYAAIAAAGSNSVGISPELFMATGTSNTLVTGTAASTSDASLIAGIKAAQAQGLKVLLEPHIQGVDGTVSNALAPTDTAAFFASYKAAIVHLATIAQATGVDTLSLGDEMSTLTGSAYRARWLDIIGAVRAVYSGKITYEAATNEASSVSFWDKVDIIGFNAYLSLSASANPSVADLEKAWTTPPADNYWASVLNGQSVVDFMHSLATTYGKQVLITEVGYRSIDGAATDPGQWYRVGTADNTDQANAYQALFQVLQSQGGSWFAGLQVWEYTVGLSNAATDYSTAGKPAMAIIQQYFSGAGAVAGLTITGSAVNDLIDVGNGDDVIKAGLGNDVIKVGAGNDTIVAGPAAITTLATTTVTVTGYGNGGQVALLLNGQQVGASVTFTPAADTSGYQTYSFTFTNPDRIRSLDVALLNGNAGGNAMIRSITINGAALGVGDVSNAGAPGTFNLYTKTIHLDAAGYQDWFYGAQSDDDLIYAGTGRDTIDGGAGLDTVVFADKADDYTLTRAGSILTVTDTGGTGNGVAVLTNVEYLQFADRTVAVAQLIVPDATTGAPTVLNAPQVTTATLSAPTTGSAPTLTVTGLSAGGATVALANGTTTLATTTADASTGAYRFSVAGLADGLYGLSVSATLGALTSAASATTTLAVGSAADIVPILLGASTTPSAVYVTDPADTIAVSVGQLRAITPALVHAVTGYSLVVTDTGASVVGAIDLLATQANLLSITLTDGAALAVSLSTMSALIANDGAVLGKIVGGYSFVVSGTGTNGALNTTRYDSTGAMTSSQTVTTTGGITETYLRNADGSTSDSFVDATGALLSQTIRNAAGTRYAVYGIAGKPYVAQVLVYNAAGTLTQLTRSYANGSVYSAMTVATDGTTSTDQFDGGGKLAQRTIVAPSGATDAITYSATGTKLTETVTNPAGKIYTVYNVTGKPYVTQVYSYDATGKGTGVVSYDATGAIYSRMTIAADGSTSTDQFGTNGIIVQTYGVTASGATDLIAYTAQGVKQTETLTSATGKIYTVYNIVGKPYATQVYSYDATGKGTGLVNYCASGAIYSRMTAAADGSTSTDQFGANGIIVQTYSVSASGATDLIAYNAAGAKQSETVTSATGKVYTLYGITGKPYTTQVFTFDASGKQTGLSSLYANGAVYSVMSTTSDGKTTTSQFGSNGIIAQTTIASANGATESIAYDAMGAKASDTIVDASGKRFTQYGITGKPYTNQTIAYDTSGKLIGVTQSYASGTVYSTKTYASDGSTTLVQYDALGNRVQQVVTLANGVVQTLLFAVSGAAAPSSLISMAADTDVTGAIALSGGTLALTADFTFTHAVTGTGILSKSAGTGASVVTASFAGLGAGGKVTIASGTLQFNGATNNLVGQAVSGAGTLALGGGGTTMMGPGTTIASAGLTIAKVGTTMVLGDNLTYAGAFSQTNLTTLALGASTMTLAGAASFNLGPAGAPLVTGTGKLITSGLDTIAGLTIGGSALFRNNGTVMQTGGVTVGDASNGAAQITNAGTWQIAGDVGIAAASPQAVLNLAGGSLIKTSGTGTSTIGGSVVNLNAAASKVEVASGTLDFLGSVKGTNGFTIDPGATLEFDAPVAAGSTVTFAGASGSLILASAPDFKGAIAGFRAGDVLDLTSIGFSGQSTGLGYQGNGASGQLVVTDGVRIASLALTGNYAASQFHLASDNHGGTAITLG